MKDMRAHLEMHRTQIAECESLQLAAKSKIKRDIFKKGWQITTEFWPPSERAIAQSKESEG
jgi:hypothetical protein